MMKQISGFMAPTCELVIAHYNESLNWLRRVPPAIKRTVYTKSEISFNHPHHSLLNVGREAHTYLHHLVSHYNSLADFTIFCQGKPFDHAYDFHSTLRILANESLPEKPFTWLGHIIDTDDSKGRLYRQWSKNSIGEGLDLEGFHQELFSATGPEKYPFFLGAQFIVSRQLVHDQSLSFYQKALTVSMTFPNAAHCYERMWDRVFKVEGIDQEWLENRETVYLKKIKQVRS